MFFSFFAVSSLVLGFLAFEPIGLASLERVTASHVVGLNSHSYRNEVAVQVCDSYCSLGSKTFLGHPAPCYLNSSETFFMSHLEWLIL